MYYAIFINDNLGLDLNMSVARLTVRKMRVTSLKYLIKALDSLITIQVT